MTQDSLLFILGGGVMSSLVGAVIYLFRSFETSKKKTEQDLDECRKDREKLWERIGELQSEVSKVQCTLKGA